MDLPLILAYVAGFFCLIVLTQDIHIFPGAFLSKAKFWRRNRKPPPNIESVFVTAQDGMRLELWRHPHEYATSLSSYCAVIFHGNGGPMENFLFVQMWLSEQGITSYSFDYRGFGRSDGWPHEKGIYADSDAVMSYVISREKIDAQKLIIIGISVGSAPAARIASIHHPKLLLLASPFTSLRAVVRAQPLVGLLAPFVRHTFATIEYVRALKETHLVLAHGLRDRIVSHVHSNELEANYRGIGRVLRFRSDDAGHNMAIYALKDVLANTLAEVLQPESQVQSAKESS